MQNIYLNIVLIKNQLNFVDNKEMHVFLVFIVRNKNENIFV